MFNYFHYRGVCSLDLGVLVSDAEPWTTKVTPETVTIPGRGDALLGYEYSNSDAVYNIIIRKTGRDTLAVRYGIGRVSALWYFGQGENRQGHL